MNYAADAFGTYKSESGNYGNFYVTSDLHCWYKPAIGCQF